MHRRRYRPDRILRDPVPASLPPDRERETGYPDERPVTNLRVPHPGRFHCRVSGNPGCAVFRGRREKGQPGRTAIPPLAGALLLIALLGLLAVPAQAIPPGGGCPADERLIISVGAPRAVLPGTEVYLHASATYHITSVDCSGVSYTLDEIGSFSEISWEFLPDQGNVGTMVDEFTVDPHFLAELTGVYVVRFSGTADIVSPANGEFQRLDFAQDVPVQVGDSPADIVIDGVEITQAVQTQEAVKSMLYISDEIVPLVAGKMTVIRVYPGVRNSSVSLNGVGATVEVVNEDGVSFRPDALWPLDATRFIPTLNPVATANLSPLISRRDNQSLSVNFLLMPWQAQGTITVRATVNPGRNVKEMDYTNNQESMTVIFEKTRPYNIHILPVHYKRAGVDLTPTNAELARIISYLRRTYPVPLDGEVKMWPVTQDITYSLVPDRGWKDLVNYMVILVGCNSGLCAASPGSLGPFPYGSDPHFYGLVPNGTPTCDMSGCNLGYGLYDHLAAAGVGGCAGIPGTCGPSSWAQEGGETFAHELAHNYNRRHAASPGGGEKQVDSNYRPVGGFIGDGGFDYERNLAIPRFNFDVMTYQSNQWTGPYTSRALFNKLEAGAAPGPGPNEPREFVEVSGIIEGTVGQETADILPLYRFMDRMEPAPPEPGHYAVELWNGSTGTQLSQYSFEPRDFSANLEVPGSLFLVFVPWVEGTDLVRVVRSGDTLAEIPVSPNPPSVAFTAPAPGTSLVGQQGVAWTAGDPDGDTLTSRIQYSADGGASWRNVAASLADQAHLLDTSRLPGTDDAYLRVLVSDGVNTASATAGPFHVPAKVPIAVIAAGDDVIFPAGTGAAIGGFAVDPEDGSVSGTGLTWTSDIDGPLGTGEVIQASLLSPGFHRLTLTARDSSGMTGESSLTVTVLPTFSLPGQVELTVLATGPAGESLEGVFRVFPGGRTIEDRVPMSVSVEAGDEVEVEAPAEITDGTRTLQFSRWDRDGVPQSGRVIRFTADAVTDLDALYREVIPGFIVDAGEDTTVDEGSPFSSSGIFADPSSMAWTATVDYGDGSGTVPLALEDHAFSLGHTYADNGVYTVTVIVTNAEENTAADDLTVTVLNVAPVVDTGPDAFLNEDVSLAGAGTFTDPGADTWTATVDYGDGTGILPLPLSANSFTLAHAYAAPGTYTVTVMVADDDLGTGTDSLVTLVIPDRIPVTADTYVDSGFTTVLDRNGRKVSVRDVNFGTGTGLSIVRGQVGGLGGLLYWKGTLISADLPPLPPVLVRNATLHLYHTTIWDERVAAFRMLVAWKETGATFSRPDVTAASWASGWYRGGNYASMPTAITGVGEQEGWYAWNVTPDVGSFLSGTPNRGWILLSAESGPTDITSTAFASREADPARRPYLRIRLAGSP